MSRINPGVLFDASRSWNGYNHQGKLALIYAIQEITGLVSAGSSAREDERVLQSRFLEIEYMEDFSVGHYGSNGEVQYDSVHQVKDRKDTALSAYKSAIQGLAKHLIDEPSIQEAYLHVTTELKVTKSFDKHVSEMIDDTKWIDNFIAKVEKQKDSEEKQEQLDELAEMKAQFANFPKDQKAKVMLFPYSIRGNDQTFCPEDEAGELLKESLKAFYEKKFPGTHKAAAAYVRDSYLYVMGRLDQHVVDRSLNFDAYQKEDMDRRIPYSRIYSWLVSQEIGEKGDEFYLYHIKELYFQQTGKYCRSCRRGQKDHCDGCRIPVFRDKLGALSFADLKVFLYRTNPDVRRELDMNSYRLFLQNEKVNDPLLKGLHDIARSLAGDPESSAVIYRDRENQQCALTTLAREFADDDYEDQDICTNILQNEEAYPLLMDYDCLISRDVDVESIHGGGQFVGVSDFRRETENIIRPRDVRIIPLEKFIAQNKKGQ